MNYFPLKLELDYSYSLGDLKPYFDALREGKALASRCPKCGKTGFPPRLICDDDHTSTEWQELEGTGCIVEMTTGKDANGECASFALIRMDGADNCALGRLKGDNLKKGDRVRLEVKNPNAEHPAQSTVYVLLR